MIPVLVLAFALAINAFLVVRGSVRRHRACEGLKISAAFGFDQGVMPLVGWWLGTAFADSFGQIDHWIAFGLLWCARGAQRRSRTSRTGQARLFSASSLPHLRRA